MMNKVAVSVENDVNYRGIIRAQATEPEATAADAISAATRQVAETLDLAAIVTYTSSGSTAVRAARERPNKPILALSPEPAHRAPPLRRLGRAHGRDRGCCEPRGHGRPRLRHRLPGGPCPPRDRIAITAGIPLGTPGATNMLRIAFVRQDGSARAELDGSAEV